MISINFPPLPPCSYLNGKERLRGKELGDPQLEVEAKTVEESPEEDDPVWPKPQRRDGVRAKRGDQLIQHVIMFTPEVIIHVPAQFSCISRHKHSNR